MIIKADERVGFGPQMKELTRCERDTYAGTGREFREQVRAELEVLAYLDEKIEKDDDAYLESLLRIAAMARYHAATCGLVYADGVTSDCF